MKGSYLLGIRVESPLTLGYGRRQGRLEAGPYLYLGSARSGLGPRLLRHAQRLCGPPHPAFDRITHAFPHAHATKGALRWHVDHLLEHAYVQLVAVWVFPGMDEPGLYPRLLGWGARPVLPGFGASDHPEHESHLFALAHDRVPYPALGKVGP